LLYCNGGDWKWRKLERISNGEDPNLSQPKRTSQENPNQRPSTLKLTPLISQVSLSWSLTHNMKNEALYRAQFPKIMSPNPWIIPRNSNSYCTIWTYLQNWAPVLPNRTMIFGKSEFQNWAKIVPEFLPHLQTSILRKLSTVYDI